MEEKSKILLIVEGKKTEKFLFEQFYKLYAMDLEKEIVSFNTDIYNFHKYLKRNYPQPLHPDKIDYENLDLYLTMKEYLDLDDEFDGKDFNDIFLIFDFDPQVPISDYDVLKELIKNFSNSSEEGKLFINYPMVESYKDYSCLNDTVFMTKVVTKKTLHTVVNKKNTYKRGVSATSFIPHIHQVTKDVGNYILQSNVDKIEFLLNAEHHPCIYRELLEYQIDRYTTSEEVFVLNTSVLHMFDEYGLIK